MARKARIEIEGGLYHVMARGNDRQTIFHSKQDHETFLGLIAAQKQGRPFYLYAYCLMSNHLHLLIERRSDSIGQIMHRVLTGYTQYYNRRYRRVGHVLQGRHKAILCQAETYMGQLVRYIHLNPVRAKMVDAAEDYPYSSHRAYLDMEPAGIVDVDPVLRLFGVNRSDASGRFAQYVNGAAGYEEEFTLADGGRILGSDEFVDATIHRIGETGKVYRPTDGHLGRKAIDVDEETLIAAVEHVCKMSRDYFQGAGKHRDAVLIKEVLIVSGHKVGASLATLSRVIGLNSSTVSRRYAHASQKMQESDETLNVLVSGVVEEYQANAKP